jgi:hypothetical protein
MANSAIYNCRRMPGYFPLQPMKGVGGNAYATRAAICQNGGKISSTYEVNIQGIIGSDGRARTTPHLLIRLHSREQQYLTAGKLFVSEGELAALAAQYELPGQLLNGAYFNLAKESNFRRSVLDVSPSYFELLDPRWKGEYLDWLKAPANRLPRPSRFPWEVFLPTVVTMPAFDGAQAFDRVKGKQLGGHEIQLLLSASGDARAVLTGAKWPRPENYVLSPAGFYSISDSPFAAEAFDPRRLSKLLLGEPGYERCSFRRQATGTDAQSEQFKISGVNKEYLRINTQAAFRLVPGADYYFTFSRQAQRVTCDCYADPQRTTLIGTAGTEASHSFFRPSFVLSRPNELQRLVRQPARGAKVATPNDIE